MIAEASRAITQQAQEAERIRRGIAQRHHIEPSNTGDSLQQEKADLLLYNTALQYGEPFYVASEPADLIASAAPSLPPYPLRMSDLPALAGFVYFAKPIPLPSSLKETARGPLRILAFAPFMTGSDRWHLRAITPSEAASRAMHITVTWVFESSRMISDTWAIGETAPHPNESRDEQHLNKIFLSFLAFIRQRVLRRFTVQGDSASRRHQERAGLSDRDCTVVMLRRAHQPRVTGEDTNIIDWSCRWWVAGHWRQQPCGEARMERRPTWISPHLKGPEDKPVRVTRRLFAVVR